MIKDIINNPIVQKIGIALLTVVITVIVLKFVCLLLTKWFDQRIKKGEIKDEKRMLTFKSVSIRLVRYIIIIVAVMTILSQFINVGALLTVAGVGTIAIGLGAQHLIEDLLAGFMILSENQFSVGDYVVLENGTYGQVESISVRTTGVRQLDGSLFIIQNGKIGQLLNYSKGETIISVLVDVAYEENIDHVIEALKAAGQKAFEKENTYFLQLPKVVGVSSFEDSGISMKVLGATAAKDKIWAEADLRKHIKETFDEYGIEIPYNKLQLLKDDEGESDAEQ